MSTPTPSDPAEQLFQQLRHLKRLQGIDEALIRATASDWVNRGAARSDGELSEETLAEFVEDTLRRAGISAEERSIRAKLAVKLGRSLDDLDSLVQRHFEGATRDIAERHFDAVRQERTRRITEGVLEALGGRGATLEKILRGAANAVTDSVLPRDTRALASQIEAAMAAMKSSKADPADIKRLEAAVASANRAIASLDPAVAAQLALAASQAVQQVALNVQKIITVALECERSGDATHPKYYYPIRP